MKKQSNLLKRKEIINLFNKNVLSWCKIFEILMSLKILFLKKNSLKGKKFPLGELDLGLGGRIRHR